MLLTEFFRLLDGLANRSFCRSDILRVQLKTNSLNNQANFIESTTEFF